MVRKRGPKGRKGRVGSDLGKGVTMIPRYNLLVKKGRWVGGCIVQDEKGEWCLWKHVEPLIQYAITMGAPLPSFYIPPGVALGVEDGESEQEGPYKGFQEEPPVLDLTHGVEGEDDITTIIHKLEESNWYTHLEEDDDE